MVALLLVLALTGPAVTRAFCELACAQAGHHQSHEAPRGCHEEGPAAGVATLSGATTVPCHGQHEESIAGLTASKFLISLAADLIQPLTPPGADIRSAPSGSTGVRLPDRPPIRTPLRV